MKREARIRPVSDQGKVANCGAPSLAHVEAAGRAAGDRAAVSVLPGAAPPGPLEIEALAEDRDLDLRVPQEAGKDLHHVLLTVNEEGARR